MRKEVIIAIIIGFTLGLVITFGIWTANNAMKKVTLTPSPSPQPEEKESPHLSPTPAEISLDISNPENNFLSNEEKVAVSGKSSLESTIVVLYPAGEKIIQTDREGNFSTEITLVGGANQIEVTAIDKNGNETSQTLNVIYSTAEI